jgi:hypothetical protein
MNWINWAACIHNPKVGGLIRPLATIALFNSAAYNLLSLRPFLLCRDFAENENGTTLNLGFQVYPPIH